MSHDKTRHDELQGEFQRNLPKVDIDDGWERLQAGLAGRPSLPSERQRQRRRRTTIAAVSVGACAIVVALVAAAALGVFEGGTQVASSASVTTAPTGGGPATVTTTSLSSTRETTAVSSGATDHVMTTSPWAVSWPSAEASEAADSAISDWPPGIEMVVLSTGYEIHVADHAGVRWSEEIQARPEDAAPGSPTPFDGVAVSNNQRFIAYADHATDIVVRSLRDGTEMSRIPYQAEGQTQLRCVSSDGNLVALASVPPDLPRGTTGDRLPWRVTIVDMRTGEATVEQPLEDLVKANTADDPKPQFTLYSLDWLPGDRLAVVYVGWQQGTYVYDIYTDVMTPIPDVAMISAVSDSGTVYGWSADPQDPRPVVWSGSTTQTLELDAGSEYALRGAFNAGGDALAIQVMSPDHQARGWQLFRLKDGRWEPSGPPVENSWMKASPRALSSDGMVAYTALEGGLPWENGQNAALLSCDFQTGEWQEWLGPEGLLVDFGQYPFVAIIPTAPAAGR